MPPLHSLALNALLSLCVRKGKQSWLSTRRDGRVKVTKRHYHNECDAKMHESKQEQECNEACNAQMMKLLATADK